MYVRIAVTRSVDKDGDWKTNITVLGSRLGKAWAIISMKTKRLLKRILRLVRQTRNEVREIKTMTQELTGDVEGLKTAVTANLAEQAETLALQQQAVARINELLDQVEENATDQAAVSAAVAEIRTLTSSVGDSTSALDASNTSLAGSFGVEPTPIPTPEG